MKAAITASSAGRFYFKLQNWRSPRSIPSTNPEQSGFVANAIIADKLIHQLCKTGGTFVDIGAQYGAVFSPVHARDSSIATIAFEADPIKAKALELAHPYAKVYGFAVGEAAGQATFYLNPKASGFNSLVPSDDPELQPIDVKVVTLDATLADETPDVIKIDVEGAELGVLRGGVKLITRSEPVIMFECVMPSENALGYSAGALWDWFADHDYQVFSPDRLAHTAPPLQRETFIDAQYYPFRSHNYFAVPSRRVTQVRDQARQILGIVA